MNNEYQENPEQQRNQEQLGNQQNQQGQYGNQQGQQGQFGNPQGQQGQFGNQQDQGGILRGARDMAQNQIDQVIDEYANKIPGGSGLSGEAKNAVGGILYGLEKDGENRIGELGGGLFGGNKEKQ